MAGVLPRAVVSYLPATSHLPILELPDAVAAAVVGCAARLLG
jgi:hypothetical protein